MRDIRHVVDELVEVIHFNRTNLPGSAHGLGEFTSGAFLQMATDADDIQDDGFPLALIELGPGPRGRFRGRPRLDGDVLAKCGWEMPRRRAMPNYWRLVESEDEARAVSMTIVSSLVEACGVSLEEVLAGAWLRSSLAWARGEVVLKDTDGNVIDIHGKVLRPREGA